MRPAVQLRLFIVGLIAVGLGSSIARAGMHLRFPPFGPFGGAGSAPPKPIIEKEFEGYGVTDELAEQSALEQAHVWIAKNLPLGWSPAPEYLRAKGMVRFGQRTTRDFDEPRAGVEVVKVVRATLLITRPQLEEMQDRARQEVRQHRQAVLFRVLAGLVVLLLVLGGYLRLEEATRGYYTGLLRITAASLLLLVAAGLWYARW
jgi:hypothetical protein